MGKNKKNYKELKCIVKKSKMIKSLKKLYHQIDAQKDRAIKLRITLKNLNQ